MVPVRDPQAPCSAAAPVHSHADVLILVINLDERQGGDLVEIQTEGVMP